MVRRCETVCCRTCMGQVVRLVGVDLNHTQNIRSAPRSWPPLSTQPPSSRRRQHLHSHSHSLLLP